MTNVIQSSSNSVEIINSFSRRVENDGDVQVIGGISISALAHPDTVIDVAHREIIVSDEYSLPSRRDDGTLRDLDVLITSSNQTRVQEVKTILRDTVGRRLEHSVFPILSNEALERQRRSPFGMVALRTLLANRYESSPDSDTYVKSIFPFATDIDPESLATWTMVIGDQQRVPVSHPGTTILNYMTRSVSGVRPRDKEKLAAAAMNTFHHSSEVKEWIIDGPGKSQLELAKIIASLSAPAGRQVSLVEGVDVSTYSQKQMAEHESFMAPHLTIEQRRRAIGIASLKACAVSRFESSPAMVSFFHRFVERYAAPIVKNV